MYGPFNLGADYTGSEYNQLETDTLNAAASTVNFPNYTHIVIVMPDGFPVGGGLGTIGCASFTSPTTFTCLLYTSPHRTRTACGLRLPARPGGRHSQIQRDTEW